MWRYGRTQRLLTHSDFQEASRRTPLQKSDGIRKVFSHDSACNSAEVPKRFRKDACAHTGTKGFALGYISRRRLLLFSLSFEPVQFRCPSRSIAKHLFSGDCEAFALGKKYLGSSGSSACSGAFGHFRIAALYSQTSPSSHVEAFPT